MAPRTASGSKHRRPNVETVVIPELEAKLVQRSVWAPEQDAIMVAYYGRVTAKSLADYLGKSIDMVYRRATTLGLRGKPQ